MMRKLESFSWEEIRGFVVKTAPLLASLIDKISPKKNENLYKSSYLYGDIFVQKGNLFLPNKKGDLVYIKDPSIDQKTQSDLTYSAIPLFLTLKNDAEVFLESNHRIIPLNLFHSGNLLGLFETMDFIFGQDNIPQWSVSAGARSIFMLPKIADTASIKRLISAFNLSSTTRLKNLSDHWSIFKEITNKSDIKNPWVCDILFFPKSWLVKNPSLYQAFREFLFKNAWTQAQFSMGRVNQSLLWESFSESISRRNLKPRPYLIDQTKHILSMCSGKLPGFRPLINNSSAPAELIKDVFLNIYQLKNYYPELIGIASLNAIEKKPIYYSLNFSTLLDGSTYNKNSNTIMVDLKEIKLLLDTLHDFSKTHHEFKNNITEKVNIDYFHAQEEREVVDVKKILNTDPDFTNRDDLVFCETSPFWKGCVRIIKK